MSLKTNFKNLKLFSFHLVTIVVDVLEHISDVVFLRADRSEFTNHQWLVKSVRSARNLLNEIISCFI